MRAAGAAWCVALLLLGAAPAAAQTFTAGTGILTYGIRADRTAAFEGVVRRLLAALRDPQRDAAAGVSLRVLRQASGAGDSVSYVLIADPALPSIDYSLAALVERTFDGGERDELRQQAAFALQSATVSAIDLRKVDAVTPLDRVEARIGLALGAPPSADAVGDQRDAALEALRGPSWTIDRLTHTMRRQGNAWAADWSLTLRNVSLTRGLDAEVVVELVDDRGGVVARSAPEWISLAPRDSSGLSGTIAVSPADGARVSAARAHMTLR
jgi:hypothetical protein